MQKTFTLPSLAAIVLSLAAQAALGQVTATTVAPYDAELAFTVSGRIAKVTVAAGDHVEAGQVIAQLADEEQRIAIEAAEHEATSDVEIKIAQAELELAQHEVAEPTPPTPGGSVSKEQIAKIELRRKLAELKLQSVTAQHDYALKQLAQAKARLAQFELRSPVAGIVESAFASPGAFAASGQRIVRIVQNQTLWVDARIPSDRATALKIGDPAWVSVTPPTGGAPIAGKIIFLSQVIDARTDTRTVRIEIANSANLLIGAYVTVNLKAPAAGAVPVTPPPIAKDH